MNNKNKIMAIIICLTLVTTTFLIVSAKKPGNTNPSNFIELPPIEQPQTPEEGFIIYCDSNDGILKALNIYGETTVLAIAELPPLFYDDFEDDTFDKWNIISGTWEIVYDGENHIAHLIHSTDIHRRMVSYIELQDNIIIEAEINGNALISDNADRMIGVYSDVNSNQFYFIAMDTLRIGNFDYGSGGDLAISSIVLTNNVWYNVKIKLENNNIAVKVWQKYSTEPLDWQVSYTVTTKYGDYLVLGTYSGTNDEEFWFDNIKVTALT